jgi:flagella basal body P-ring formation protein FlgA
VEWEIRNLLARRWGVVPEALVLAWGQPRGGEIPEGYSHVDLVGHGRGGRWVVSFKEGVASRGAISVLLRAGVEIQRPVASRALERGKTLGEGDMTVEAMTHWGPVEDLPGASTIGWVAQRSISAGELLTEPAVKPPLLVVSGRPVEALWSEGNLELKIQGTAVGSGAMGERVYVRTSGGRRLDGVVQGPGLVQISNPRMEQEQ